MEIVLPILIVEGLDIQAFPSLQSAQSYLEPWWVEENRGQVYDASGRSLTATCRKKKVVLSLELEASPQIEKLAEILRAHFRATGKLDIKDECDLSHLIEKITNP